MMQQINKGRTDVGQIDDPDVLVVLVDAGDAPERQSVAPLLLQVPKKGRAQRAHLSRRERVFDDANPVSLEDRLRGLHVAGRDLLNKVDAVGAWMDVDVHDLIFRYLDAPLSAACWRS